MTGAGDLREVIEIWTPTDGDDGFGGVIPGAGPPALLFSAPARIQILRGTETVMSGRLQGKQTIAITMRWQPEFADADSTWTCKNGRTGLSYNIRSIEPDERKAFVNILTETGTP